MTLISREILKDFWQKWNQEQDTFGHIHLSPQSRFESFVPHFMDGMRFDQYLAKRFKYFSRAEWKDMIEAKGIHINGRFEKPTYRVKPNDFVQFKGQEVTEPPVPTQFEILFENQDFMVIQKPAHIPMHQCGRYLKNTIIMLLEKYKNEKSLNGDLRLCHRLDLETSGLVVVTKNIKFHREMARAFEEDNVHKMYLAICFGVPKAPSWTQEAAIGRALESQIKMKLWEAPDGIPSSTRFELLQTSGDQKFSLLAAFPQTGRTNQIRVHAAVSGVPLVGDKNYYPDERIFLHFYEHGYDPWLHERLLSPRCLLHAYRLQFNLTSFGAFCFTAPLPPDFKRCLAAFDLHVSMDSLSSVRSV